MEGYSPSCRTGTPPPSCMLKALNLHRWSLHTKEDLGLWLFTQNPKPFPYTLGAHTCRARGTCIQSCGFGGHGTFTAVYVGICVLVSGWVHVCMCGFAMYKCMNMSAYKWCVHVEVQLLKKDKEVKVPYYDKWRKWKAHKKSRRNCYELKVSVHPQSHMLKS